MGNGSAAGAEPLSSTAASGCCGALLCDAVNDATTPVALIKRLEQARCSSLGTQQRHRNYAYSNDNYAHDCSAAGLQQPAAR